jgi:hypothetical protein
MKEKLLDFYEVNVKVSIGDFCTEMTEFTLDVYIDVGPKYRVWLIDINPWFPYEVDSMLFSWDEL